MHEVLRTSPKNYSPGSEGVKEVLRPTPSAPCHKAMLMLMLMLMGGGGSLSVPDVWLSTDAACD